jgi:hypothetical protein
VISPRLYQPAQWRSRPSAHAELAPSCRSC